MPVIIISRGSLSSGREIAEKAAQRLGYACISREILIEASQEFDIPEIKLTQVFEDVPSFLDRITHGKEKYTAYMRSALLKYLKADNVVYHGFAGHFLVTDISHVLKVRVIAELEDRVRIVMGREGISRREALRFIKRVDDQRRRWSRKLYGMDIKDPALYDLVFHIGKITVEDAVSIICEIVSLRQFQTTAQSQKAMADLALAAEVMTILVGVKPKVEVSAENGIVSLSPEGLVTQDSDLVKKIGHIVRTLPEVRGVRIIGKRSKENRPSEAKDIDVKSTTKDKIRTFFGEMG